MKKNIFFFVFSFIYVVAYCGNVDTSEAAVVAKNYLLEKGFSGTKSNIELKLVSSTAKDKEYPFYIFNVVNGKGFVIVSSRDELVPVLAYSTESNFDFSTELPPALSAWLDSASLVVEAAEQGKIKPDLQAQEYWNKYSDKEFVLAKAPKAIVGPLMTTTWNQGTYYNAMCPEDSDGPDGHVWAGCVATAMAQILKYWEYPHYGSGDHSYTHSTYGVQYADFEHTEYKWDSMPNSLSDYNYQVARLMYHCGVAVNMNYSPSGSGASVYTARYAFVNDFDYSHYARLIYKYSYSEAQWDSMVMAQLDRGIPLLYAGYGSSGHAFNVDGYDFSSDSLFHLNWGWGGSYNGWYRLDDLTPGSYSFNSSQQAVFDLYPGYGDTSHVVLTDPSGTIRDNGGTDNYENLSYNTWLISPSAADKILLSFSEMDLVAGQDTLYIYDGGDESAPLLAALSIDTVPPAIMSTGASVFLKFVSDSVNTGKGFTINYDAKKLDLAAQWVISPDGSSPCAVSDSILFAVKNLGYETITSVPVHIIIHSPSGDQTIDKTIPVNLAYNEYDTLFAGVYDMNDAGIYTFDIITTLPGDADRSNDTIHSQFEVKEPASLPFYEAFDEVQFENGEWTDDNWSSWLDGEYWNTDSANMYYVSMYSAERVPFLQYTRKIGPVSNKSFMRFDLKVEDGQSWPRVPAGICDTCYVSVLFSTDCGETFDTVFVVNKDNYVDDTVLTTYSFAIDGYQDNEVLIAFGVDWGSGFVYATYDNIIIADSISNNFITDYVCTPSDEMIIYGSEPEGGLPPFRAYWEISENGLDSWEIADSSSIASARIVKPETEVYMRRILVDSLGLADTSDVKFIDPDNCVLASVDIYPNPSNGVFMVNLPDRGIVEIIDLNGKVVYKKSVNSPMEEINAYNLRKGIYLFRFVSDKKVIVKKIVID